MSAVPRCCLQRSHHEGRSLTRGNPLMRTGPSHGTLPHEGRSLTRGNPLMRAAPSHGEIPHEGRSSYESRSLARGARGRPAHAGWGGGAGATGGAAGGGDCGGPGCHGAGAPGPRSLRREGSAQEAPLVPSTGGGRSPGQPDRRLPDVPAAPVRERGASRARARL